MDVIKKLNDLRLERKMSVYRLAELTGINQSTLANTFSRGIIPSVGNLELLCEAMGLTLSQFFAEDERAVLLTPEERIFFTEYKKGSMSNVVVEQIKNNYNKFIFVSSEARLGGNFAFYTIRSIRLRKFSKFLYPYAFRFNTFILLL